MEFGGESVAKMYHYDYMRVYTHVRVCVCHD